MRVNPPDPNRQPPYQRIAADLRQRISRREFPPGAWLPSLADLRATYRVSETTAAKAVAHLAAEGLVRTQAGVGAWVAYQQGLLTHHSPPQWWSAYDAGNPSPATITWEAAEPFLAGRLGVPPGTAVLHHQWTLAHRPVPDCDGTEPLPTAAIVNAWYPPAVAKSMPSLAEPGPPPMALWVALPAAGHPVTSATERWQVRHATGDEARILEDLPTHGRVLEGWRIASGPNGTVVEVTHLVLAEGAYRLEFHYQPQALGPDGRPIHPNR